MLHFKHSAGSQRSQRSHRQAGMVFHFIPWFQKYNEPSGPIGLSDTVIVTTEGGRRFGELPLTVKSVESVEIS